MLRRKISLALAVSIFRKLFAAKREAS